MKLGEVADVSWGDTSTTKAAYASEGYLAYSATGPDGYLPWAAFDETGIVVSAIGAQAGKTWLAKGKWSCIKNTIRVLATQPEVSVDFLYWATREPSIWPLRGSAQPFISQADARGISLRLPPYAEQWSIAALLGALDDKIAANTRLVRTLDELFIARWRQVNDRAAARERSLDSMVLDSIGGDWGVDQPTPTHTEAVYCIRGADISSLQESGLGKMPNRHIKRTSLERRIIRDGDIVVEMSGGSPTQSTGRAAIITGHLINRLSRPIVSSNFCRVLRLKDSTYSHFVYGMLRWDWTNGEFFQFENGSTGIKNLAFKDYSARKLVPSFPLGEISSFNSDAEALLGCAHAAGEETERLIASRDALLPQLMSGKLRVKVVEKALEGAL